MSNKPLAAKIELLNPDSNESIFSFGLTPTAPPAYIDQRSLSGFQMLDVGEVERLVSQQNDLLRDGVNQALVHVPTTVFSKDGLKVVQVNVYPEGSDVPITCHFRVEVISRDDGDVVAVTAEVSDAVSKANREIKSQEDKRSARAASRNALSVPSDEPPSSPARRRRRGAPG